MLRGAGERPDLLITRRELNRALLARQLLLERARLPVADAIEHLVGLQAQDPLPPYLALWSRLHAFDPDELGRMLVDRKAVRLTLMRGTIHLVTARDALRIRPLLQGIIERVLRGAKYPGDVDTLRAAVRELLAEEALTERELGRKLVERGIAANLEELDHSHRVFLPLVHVPPRGVWGQSGRARYAVLEDWLGQPLLAEPSIDELVRRYLAAFGPASVADMQYWSGLTRLRDVFERLRTELVTLRDEDGKELFDLPDAPRPGEDVDAPVRLLGVYDNVLLGHADRRRIVSEDFPWRPGVAGGRFVSSLLVDGMLRGTWWLDGNTLTIRPSRGLRRRERWAVEDEAARATAFLAPESKGKIRFADAVT